MVDYYAIFKELNDNILQKPTALGSAIKKPMDISNVSAWIIGLGAIINSSWDVDNDSLLSS